MNTTHKPRNLLLTSATDLTLSDRRLYNYLLHNAFSKPERQLDFSIPLVELKGVYGTGLPPIGRLRESLKRLTRTLIEFEISPRTWILTSLLEKSELDEQQEELRYSYSTHCRDLFLDPFTLEKCLIQAHFTQKYSNLLYEILSEAHFSGQETVTIDVSDLRDHLLIPTKKLSNFGDLKRFVLIPALAEINAYASFAVKFDTERKGMKVTHVIFKMIQKKNISSTKAKDIIPPRRPLFFIDNPEAESAYAYLLNAETEIRRKLFNKALKSAAKSGVSIDEEDFDRPDLWFQWIQSELMDKN